MANSLPGSLSIANVVLTDGTESTQSSNEGVLTLHPAPALLLQLKQIPFQTLLDSRSCLLLAKNVGGLQLTKANNVMIFSIPINMFSTHQESLMVGVRIFQFGTSNSLKFLFKSGELVKNASFANFGNILKQNHHFL